MDDFLLPRRRSSIFDMFTTATSLSNLNVPRFETRKALIVINLQNDSFYQQDDVFICKNRDFVEEIKTLVPYFRNTGDIVWVRTEISLPAASSSTSSRTEEEMAKQDTKNRHEQEASEQQLEDDTGRSEPKETKTQYVGDKKMTQKGAQTYHPLSHVKSMESRASAQARADHRSANRSILKDNTNIWEEKLAKSRKGQQPKFYVAGTPGAEMLDGLKAFVDDERDMTVIKQFYSAFDQTSLLMSLRMRLVTELYICGCFTNVGVYATAVDAVQHGFEVNIVEDCVGFRSEDKHDEAMRQMADVLGVNGTDSEEIIEELGGRAPPDAAEPMFSGPGPEGISLRDLSLAAGQSKVVPGRGTPNWKNAKIIKGHPSKEAESKASVNTRITRTSTGRGTGDNSSAEQTVELVAEQSQVEQPFELNPLPALGASCSKSRKFLPSASSYMKPGDNIGTGDSRILHKVLSSPLSDDAFQLLGEEVDWQTMHHRGGEVPRLVAVQGQIGKDGSVPLYRHPADESPPLLRFSPTVERIRRVVEEAVKQPLNHVLIQLYRDGIDNISEHSDKVSTDASILQRQTAANTCRLWTSSVVPT